MHVYLFKLSDDFPSDPHSRCVRCLDKPPPTHLGCSQWQVLWGVRQNFRLHQGLVIAKSQHNQRTQPSWYHETWHSCQRRLAKTKYIKSSDTNKLAHDTKKPYNHARPPLLGRRVLGDSLGTLRDSVLGEFTTKYQVSACCEEEEQDTYGRMSRTEVWISREEMVDRWL